MKQLLWIVIFIISFCNVSYSQNTKTLPDEFFIECDLSPLDLHLIHINQITLLVSMKIPDIDTFEIYKNTDDEIIFKKYGTSGGVRVFFPPEFRFNKWSGVLTKEHSPGGIKYRSSQCKILDKFRKPLYG